MIFFCFLFLLAAFLALIRLPLPLPIVDRTFNSSISNLTVQSAMLIPQVHYGSEQPDNPAFPQARVRVIDWMSKQTSEWTYEQVAQYLRLDSWVFWTIVKYCLFSSPFPLLLVKMTEKFLMMNGSYCFLCCSLSPQPTWRLLINNFWFLCVSKIQRTSENLDLWLLFCTDSCAFYCPFFLPF